MFNLCPSIKSFFSSLYFHHKDGNPSLDRTITTRRFSATFLVGRLVARRRRSRRRRVVTCQSRVVGSVRILGLRDALVLAVVAVLLVERVARVLVLHRVRLAGRRSVGGRRVGVSVGVVLVLVVAVCHPSGAVHGLHTASTTAARVDASTGGSNVSMFVP